MWVSDMTDEQEREYGFVVLSIEEMRRLGYVIEKNRWKKVQTSDRVRRMSKSSGVRSVHREGMATTL